MTCSFGISRLCLLADSPTAYASLIRRDNIRGFARHTHGGQDGQCTVKGMEAFFDNWTLSSLLLVVKYEVL
jgi:hypothetical protein